MYKPKIPNPELLRGYISFAHRHYSFLDWIKVGLGNLLVGAISIILRIGGNPTKEAVIRGLSGLAYKALPSKRRIALINLDLVYGESISEERKQEIVHGMFEHFVRMVLDLMFSEVYWPSEKLLQYVGQDDSEEVDKTVRPGKGHALLSGHVGNLEMMQHVAAARGYPLATIYKGFQNPWFDLFIGRKRLARGNGLIEVPSSRHTRINGKRKKIEQRGIAEDVEQVWREGGGIAAACDQYARHSRVKMPFLGIPDCPMQVGLIRMIIKNKIPFTLHATVYDQNYNPKWIHSKAYFIEDQATPDETLFHYLTIINDWLEEQIHQYPEQFYWGHRRFTRSHYDKPREEAIRYHNQLKSQPAPKPSIENVTPNLAVGQ